MEPNIEKSDGTLEERDVVDTDFNNNGALESSGHGASIKLDKHGLPLVPQPTDHIDDPLVNLLLFPTPAEIPF